MVKKDKAKKAAKKERSAQKQEKKAGQKDKKQKKKGAQEDDSDAEDVDLDAVLAEYAKQQEQFLKVTESVCEPPSPRGSGTIIGSPTKTSELLLFGGEYFNGALASFYNDLLIYNINRDEWRSVTSPNSPLPRSGHAWTRAGNTNDIYLFGGEFSSPKQGTFYHYNDFWRLDPNSREWTRVESKGKSPPARSGHRMTYFKKYIVLFGGFQDTSQQTKYLSDVWLYDCQTFTWHNPALPPASPKPDARSSFSFLPHDSGAVLYGGYSRVKASSAPSQKSKGSSSKVTMKPIVHQDTFLLRITPPSADSSASSPPKVIWERRKRPANAPNPSRAGATMAYHKGRGVMFGGVHDVEESDEGIDSEFFNQLFVWNIDRNRFFPLTLRRPRTGGQKKSAQADRGKRSRGRADEEELLKNLAALEMKGKIDPENEASADTAMSHSQAADEEDEPDRPEKPVIFELPHPRFNAQLTVQDDTLYIYGGTFEKGDREYTLDELWAINLGPLDGVKEIFKRDVEDWQGSDGEDEEDEDEGDVSGFEDSDEETLMGQSETASTVVASDVAADSMTMPMQDSQELLKAETEEDAEIEEQDPTVSDALPHPRPFEALREFYDRTTVAWQELVVAELQNSANASAKTVKELRKIAFERAEAKWWDCREEITKLEDEQLEAGIGEVVNLSDKAKDGLISGPGRRR